jgi:hypothetical protein
MGSRQLTGLTFFPFLRNLAHDIIRPIGVDKENLDSNVTPYLHAQPGLNGRELNVRCYSGWGGHRGFSEGPGR